MAGTLPHTSLDDILAQLATGETAPAADQVFAAGKGPVLADDTNGHTYRLVPHNGALTLVQVT